MDRYYDFRRSPPERDDAENNSKFGVRRNLEPFYSYDDLPLENKASLSFNEEDETSFNNRSYDSRGERYDNFSFWRLEDSILRDSEDYTLKGSDGHPEKIPARIRDIITRNLTTEELSGPLPSMASNVTATSLQEENRLLSHELNRLEDLLSASRAERDEIGIKYNALSERVSNFT
ncbi:hypothetical protein Btru_049644 [Bulinus truncatus]|nr:hypothetical protein Btru_049644 [Bulinus truncatus]